ncbi:assimilatory sulfite reductase [Fomitopsis serialis]|uniref:assimilatory sulfite reductase n=1 Tax=Fomitopsis serialis TaxID=139415 RepID=UPI0020082619|nr:assimilatory sulfite reductase [Neoantrodia serialis]KAH9938518.1 assimilatory sulfite reductase [Neoantrodia serialis]
MPSGISTPASSTATLSAPGSPRQKAKIDVQQAVKNALISASTAVEFIASRTSSSSSVFIYDVAENVGFGAFTKEWAGSSEDVASVVSLQTRAGAGLSLVGRLSQGTSKDSANGAVLTAYTTPSGLAMMVQSLTYLPPSTPSSRLTIQVPAVTAVGESFALSPTLAPFTPVLAILPENFTVLLSATPRETIDFAALAYKLTDTHVIHLFDHHGAARESGHTIVPALPVQEPGLTAKDGLKKAGYDAFEYAGDKGANTVVVLLNGPLALVAKAVAAKAVGLGVVVVKMLRPWDEEALREVVPSTAKIIHVFDDVPAETTQGSLYMDVFASVLDPLSPGPTVKSHRIVPARTQEFLDRPSVFTSYLCGFVPAAVPAFIDVPNTKKVLFFSTPGSPLASLARSVEQTFVSFNSISARLLRDHDVCSKPGGLTADRLVFSPKDENAAFTPTSVALPLTPDSTGEADFVAVLDQGLLKSHEVIAHAAPGSPVLIATTWSASELLSNLPASVVSCIHERNLHIYITNPVGHAEEVTGGGASEALQDILLQIAFLRLYLGQAAREEVVIRLVRKAVGDKVQDVPLEQIVEIAWNGLVELEIPAPQEVPAEDAAKEKPLKHFTFNAISVETSEGETVVNGARLGSWHDAAKHIIFPSAFTPQDAQVPSEDEYAQNPALRPEVPDRTYLVTCTVNLRLTPLDYDRNVFHLEFDTRGTGLKYEIGEALGVHGWNDVDDVDDFCSWYGADPNKLVTIPVPNTDGTRMHTRTVFQALQQQVDLFGKPGKTFYTELAEYATNKADQYALRFIGSPEGSATFKKLTEKDTVTFADILRRYETARPGVEVLCELVGDIKPRHYSIASAQTVVGDQVDLLVVSVDWVTPSGTPRYGQCTRYLAGLKPGQKLPPDNMQPIIMAGLGTGAAPFRAFLQHRAWLKSQSVPVGPTYYYFGSRHRSQEYLYGEELEAFIDDGIITRAGLAFSRDGPRKKGAFYLCGPTWPVPDVYEALVEALMRHTGQDAVQAGDFLEGLKEEERYVLEVY